MRLPKPRAVQFQISVKARIPKRLKLPRSQYVSDVVHSWANGDELPEGWRVRVNIWEHGKSREVEPGNDDRGLRLRTALGRALQEGRLKIKTVGGAK